MKRTIIAAALVLGIASPAAADVFTYACHDDVNEHELHAATLDTGKHTLTWRGLVYKNVRNVTASLTTDQCAKECFSNKPSDKIVSDTGPAYVVLSTATQGWATLDVQGMAAFDCNLVRP
jgi:hypothetical protein